MKKFIFTLAVTMLTTHLPAAPISLSVSALSNGRLQIITSGASGSITHEVYWVLQSTTDFVSWTAISTNTLPPGFNGAITNFVQTTNTLKFYRIYIHNVTYDQLVFNSSNPNGAANDSGNRVELIGATGSSSVAGSSVDTADASQAKYSGLNTTTSGVGVDTGLNEYFVAADNAGTHILSLQRGTVLGGGGALTTFYTNPWQDFNGTTANVALVGLLALDSLHGELYFAQAGVDANSGDAVAAATGIYKVSIAGTTGTPTLFTPSSNTLFQPTALALDLKDNLLFFTDAYDSAESFGAFPSVNNLDVANLSTGVITVLHGFASQEMADPDFIVQGLAVDSANGKLYLTTANFASNTSSDNAILKIPFTPTGAGSTANASIGTISTLYSGAGAFQSQDLAIDAAQGIFYTSGQAAGIGAIYEGSLSNNGTGSLTLVESLSSIVPAPTAGDLIPQILVLSPPTVVASGTVSAVSGGGAVTVDPSATVSEPDNQLLTGATITGALTGDTLSYNGGSSHTFSDGFTISSSFSGGTLSLSGNATAADYQSALDAVTFATTSSNDAARALGWTVSDASFTSATSNSTITVLP